MTYSSMGYYQSLSSTANENMPPLYHQNHLIFTQWTQQLTQLLHTHALTLWKAHSAYLYEHTNRTHEHHIKKEAYLLMISLRKDPSQLPASPRHLIHKLRRYSMKSKLHNTNAWSDRVKTALQTKTRIDEKGLRDIHKWNCIQSQYTAFFHKDNPNYDSDATEEFYVHFPDEQKSLNT